MKNIRKIIKDKRNQQKKPHNTMLITKKIIPQSHIYRPITLQSQKIIKFIWDQWVYQNSLLPDYQTQKSKYFQCLSYFKKITHAKKQPNFLVIYLDKQYKTKQRTQLDYFIEKYKKNPTTIQFSQKLDHIQRLENDIRVKYLKQPKNNSGPFTSLGKDMIHSIFLKSLAKFKNEPFVALGNNMNFTTMKPFIQCVAISYSMLELLQRDPNQFIIECIQTQTIPDIFTNYGFKQFNEAQFTMVEQILERILMGKQEDKKSNVERELIRQMVDAYENKRKVIIRSSFEVPIYSAFEVIKIISEQGYRIEGKVMKRQSIRSVQQEQRINKILYGSIEFKEYVQKHTASFRETDKKLGEEENKKIVKMVQR